MSLKYLTYTYRVYPTLKQKKKLDLTFLMCKAMYNTILKMKSDIYYRFCKYTGICIENSKNPDELKFFSENQLPKLSSIKKVDDNYKIVDSLALCQEEKNVMRAFENFYSGRCKFPKFKKRKDKNSYTTSNVNENIRVENDSIRLPKIGFVKAVLHRKLPDGSVIKKAVVKEDKTGKYYVALVIVYNENLIKEAELFGESIGLDFKVGEIFVANNGFRPEYSKPYRVGLEKLRELEKKLGKKLKFSKKYWEYINKMRRLHYQIAFKRKDFLHKTSNLIANKYNNVYTESLSMREIAQKLSNGINTYDTSYFSFLFFLSYKIKGLLIKIDKWFPSTKTCSFCGMKKKKMKISQRQYNCNFCGLSLDRDVNAAINILNEGDRIRKNIVIENNKTIFKVYRN